MSGQFETDEQRRKRAENFKLNIPDEELNPAEDTRPRAFREEESTLNSFSSPAARQDSSDRQRVKKKQSEDKEHHRRNKDKRGGNRLFFRLIWLGMVLLVAIVGGQYAVSGVNDMLAVGRVETEVTLDVPKDATIETMANLLEKNHLINNLQFFKIYASVTKNTDFNAGTYKVKTNMDYQALINTLQSNTSRVDTVQVVFQEGMSIQEIAAQMEKKGVCNAADILALCNSTKFDERYSMVKAIPNASQRYYKLEGYVFPDTYEFYMDEDPESALRKLVSNCNKKLTQEMRDQATEQGMTVDQLLNLAAIVQAEAANEDDMYQIASILQNRLKDGPDHDIYTLDCDSTTYYPYRNKSAAEAAKGEGYKSTYDTYKQRGLPPGPICNPGMAAIEAVLNAPTTKNYYFCHNPVTKQAFYAATLKQHNQNLKKAGLVK